LWFSLRPHFPGCLSRRVFAGCFSFGYSPIPDSVSSASFAALPTMNAPPSNRPSGKYRLAIRLNPTFFAPVIRACGLLGLSAASLTMAFLLVVFVEDLHSFLVKNVVDASVRKLLLIAPAA